MKRSRHGHGARRPATLFQQQTPLAVRPPGFTTRHMSDPIILPLGGCLLHGPISHYQRTVRPVTLRLSAKGVLRETYAIGEMFQIVDFLDGVTAIPREVKPFIGMDADFKPLATADFRRDTDIVVIEPNTSMEIHFDNFILNRTALTAAIVEPIRKLDPSQEMAKKTYTWLNKGVLGGDAFMRKEIGKDLASFVSGRLPACEIIGDILLNATAHQADIQKDMQSLHHLLNHPMALVTFTFEYLPDGQPVSWPANFMDDTVAAARKLGAPIFEPFKLVAEHGVEQALKPDRRHYADDFVPIVGKAIVDFARRAL